MEEAEGILGVERVGSARQVAQSERRAGILRECTTVDGIH